ncbi:helix-turn-helix domain-containing protein [Sulfobacillus thermosulfidooxidans]|uniref:helix-turn-helix domain-containing protein n=1 Tax=Sulfobacillus thermosulfidooxidans TaxID=28034 RepID=UPI0006B5B6A4|nr:LexA family transcriptional regulator [Sulfobacillus thermosulfidooxidans]
MEELSFGAKLQAIRKRLGLSQTDLAKLIGTTQNNISRYELGLRQPSFDMLKKIADALNISMDDLSDSTIISVDQQARGSSSPSWASFVVDVQTQYHLTTDQLAFTLDVGLSDLLPPRSVARPSIRVAFALANFLQMPTLAMAVIAGYMDPDAALDRVVNVMQWPWRKMAPYHSDWFNQQGGSYLRTCRQAHRHSVTAVVQHWNAHWNHPVSEADWTFLEDHGVLRTPWDSRHPTTPLDELPGVWLWALMDACVMDPPTVYQDVVGLTALLGRISRHGKARQVWFSGHQNYEDLLAAFTAAHDKARDTVNMRFYRGQIHAIAWATPSTPPTPSTPEWPVRAIPLLGRVIAGVPVEAQTDHHGDVWIPRDDPGDFAVTVHGDSMLPAGITEGDTIIVEHVPPGRDVPPNTLVVALVDGEQTLKWVIRQADGSWWLRAANPRYADMPLDPERDRIVGIVRGIQRRPPSPLPRVESGESPDPWAGLTPDQRDLLQAQQRVIEEQQRLMQSMLVRFRRMNQANPTRIPPDDGDPPEAPF